ncbi:MAG: hypothetical protein FJ271_08595 [Planctomycetes bacterium]|nr:hypothetical protein [Planctomycetota bacterium]
MARFCWAFAITIFAVAPSLQAQTVKKTYPPRPKLPRDHEYQRVLIKHMSTLTEKDFAHGVTMPLPTKIAASDDPEYQYRNHLFTLMQQPLVGTKRGVPAINAPPGLFVLSAIETPKGVLKPPVWPETLIPFVQWKYPGNLYHDSRALKLRAFVTAAVMMMMLDANFDDYPELGRTDWYSYQLVYFGLPYPGFKDILPAEVRQAYAAGLKRAGERVLGWGAKWEEPHSDLAAPFGLLCVARVIDDPAFSKTVEAFARKLYTDPNFFDPAGYWTFRGGIDLPFQGHANYFAVMTGLMSDWTFVKDALERAYRLRAHVILPEPDGKLSGPSHFNARVSGPASIDQWSWNRTRDVAAAMLTDEAAHIVPLPSANDLRDAPSKRAQQFNGQIAENPVRVGNGSKEAAYVFTKNHEIVSHPWERRIWSTFNFPASVNPAVEFYRPGTYARRLQLEKKKSPMVKSPFERGETFVRAFDNDFLVCRQPGYAAILHTGPVGFQDGNPRMHQFPGPMGLSGGQLSAYWTPKTGAVLLGQRGGMAHQKSFDVIDAWRTWPNHSVSGVTAGGIFFTSARIREPAARFEIAGDLAKVRVSGTVPPAIVGQAKSIKGKYDYARSFQIDSNGVSVETTLQGAGSEKIAELYETLPVYLRDAATQPKAKPTMIDFQVGDKWQPATDRFAAVQAVRLTRFDGAVLITFDRVRRAKLSAADWSDTFLSRGTARNVLVDLMETNDGPTELTGTKKVRYRITPLTQ